MTDEELRDEILTRDPQDYEAMIETVLNGIFSYYSGTGLDTIGEAFDANGIDTTEICKIKRPN